MKSPKRTKKQCLKDGDTWVKRHQRRGKTVKGFCRSVKRLKKERVTKSDCIERGDIWIKSYMRAGKRIRGHCRSPPYVFSDSSSDSSSGSYYKSSSSWCHQTCSNDYNFSDSWCQSGCRYYEDFLDNNPMATDSEKEQAKLEAIDLYILEMANDGEWGGDPELAIGQKLFGPICVWVCSKKKSSKNVALEGYRKCDKVSPQAGYSHKRDAINIFYNYSKRGNGNHYDALVKTSTGFKFHKIRGDGNCLFSAIGANIGLDATDTRSAIVQGLQHYRKFLLDFFIWPS